MSVKLFPEVSVGFTTPFDKKVIEATRFDVATCMIKDDKFRSVASNACSNIYDAIDAVSGAVVLSVRPEVEQAYEGLEPECADMVVFGAGTESSSESAASEAVKLFLANSDEKFHGMVYSNGVCLMSLRPQDGKHVFIRAGVPCPGKVAIVPYDENGQS